MHNEEHSKHLPQAIADFRNAGEARRSRPPGSAANACTTCHGCPAGYGACARARSRGRPPSRAARACTCSLADRASTLLAPLRRYWRSLLLCSRHQLLLLSLQRHEPLLCALKLSCCQL